MNKKDVTYAFVVLVYRNTDDLISFISSVKKLNIDYEIVVVNSYYDEISKEECLNVALTYKCHFLNVENRGYGYGNNRGIEYAQNKFNFKNIILSNPDIEIEKFDTRNFEMHNNEAFGGIIKTLKKKSQNPYWAVNNRIGEYFIYLSYKYKVRVLYYLVIIFNKCIRELFLFYFGIVKQRWISIFALHGSFIVFPKNVLDKIGLPFDEEMFLFVEEAHLAHLLKRNGIKSSLTKDIKVLHKEDGSISKVDMDNGSYFRKSILTYYEKL